MRMRAERKQRKAERKHGDTEGHCMTPGSRHVRHPGLGMHDTRVSDTRKRLTGQNRKVETDNVQ